MNFYHLFFVFSLAFLVQCKEKSSIPVMEATHTSDSMSIDGLADEATWQKAKPIVLQNNRTGHEVQSPELKTEVKAAYDDHFLYFLFECKDPDIWAEFTQRDEYLWKEEVVEVFIDVDDEPETYIEIEVSPANIIFDSYIVDPKNIDVPETAKFNLPGLKTGVTVQGTLSKRDDKDNSWTVEMAIPFEELATSASPQVGPETTIKINFYRLDKNKGKEFAAYAWSPTGKSFHQPSAFGKLVFKK